mgnify:CR=1 FL=1|tara:strand:+ start:1338 stop:1748 length:411 start_codon:yes stop_codon:yes gene_type:complete
MKIYKKSHNPYLNLIKSINYLYQDAELNISEKLTQYNAIFNTLKNDLSNYKFYTHPSFNDKWYKQDVKSTSCISDKINLNNPWHVFIYNFIYTINSTYLSDTDKYTSITKELAWFDGALRVQDWVIIKPIRKQKYA